MELGRKLWIRSLVKVSAEPIPFFWPMRTFVHHNPLHELEHLDFFEAVKEGERIFRGRGFLNREGYQYLMKKGYIDENVLKRRLREFIRERKLKVEGLDLEDLLYDLMTCEPVLEPEDRLYREADLKEASKLVDFFREDPSSWAEEFRKSIGKRITLPEAVDLLTGLETATVVDELTVRNAISFLDEGQASVGMPKRELGLFRAWKELVRHNLRFILKVGIKFWRFVQRFDSPEEAIEYVLRDLKVPQDLWSDYITVDLARLKGIVGFIRWRSQNRDYYWQKKYPADVVDYAAIRLLVTKAVLSSRARKVCFEPTYEGIRGYLESATERAYLRYEYFSGNAPPMLAEKLRENISDPLPFLGEYLEEKAKFRAAVFWTFLSKWLSRRGIHIGSVNPEVLKELIGVWKTFKEEEGKIWLKAMEDTLIGRLVSSLKVKTSEGKRPEVQALFCIDVRSERFRRNLEKVAGYETFGVAGFFGVPMAFVELEKGHEEFLCPVLIRPRNVVLELPSEGRETTEKESLFEEILHDLKQNILTPYITVEAIGFLFGFDFIGRTFAPSFYGKAKDRLFGQRVRTRILIDKLKPDEIERIVRSIFKEKLTGILASELGRPPDPGKVDSLAYKLMKGEDILPDLEDILPDGGTARKVKEKIQRDHGLDRGLSDLMKEKLKHVGFSKEEQALLIANALRSIGLTENFARVILVLGHGSKSENNPYESALDCGACGGAAGMHNARVFCLMANDPQVRRILKERFSINIPEDTFFVPGLHNTTTDEVTLYDFDMLPPQLTPLIDEIREALRRAKVLTATERADELPKTSDVEDNAHDWSQVRPEWGLSGNYAFIIGRRDLTEGLDLGGRVFLHSYDYRKDPKGFFLENIFSGPLVVGQWINMEHYFSTTDNEVYGSGSKVYHNVAGRIGVMTGNLSDLRTGLPLQTVMEKGKPHHAPVRLIAVVEAPLEMVDKVVKKVYHIRMLLTNGWINMVVLDPEERKTYRYISGRWQALEVNDA